MDSPSYSTNSASTTASPSTSPAALFLSAFGSPPPQSKFLPSSDSNSNSASGFEAGDVLNGYTLGKQIGQGAFSVIRLATCPTRNAVVAFKLATATTNKRKDKDKLDRERRIWESLSHEHILPLFTAFTIADRTCFVTMYCPAGSLYDLLKSQSQQGGGLPAPLLQPLFTQLVRALVYLHTEARVVHRDLKLENVLVDEGGGVRLADFGLAKGVDDDVDDDDDSEEEEEEPSSFPFHRTLSISTSTPSSGIITRKQSLNVNLSSHPSLIRPSHTPRHRHSTTSHTPSRKPKKSYGQPGSLPYAAPELLSSSSSEQQQPTTKVKVNPAQDIWALGILLHTLLTGKLPWNDVFEPRLVWRIVCGPYSLPTNISPLASRILLGCLERDPGKRWNAGMVDEVAWGVTQHEEEEIIVTEQIRLISSLDSSPSDAAVSLSPHRDPSHSLSPTRRRRRSRDPSLAPYSKSKSASRSVTRSRDSYSEYSYSESRSPPPALSYSVQSVLSTASNDLDDDDEETRFPRRRHPQSPGSVFEEEGEMMRGRPPTRRHSPLFPPPSEGLPLPLPMSSIGFPPLPLALDLDKDGTQTVEGLPPLGIGLSPVHVLSPVPLSGGEDPDSSPLSPPLIVPNPPLLLHHHHQRPRGAGVFPH